MKRLLRIFGPLAALGAALALGACLGADDGPAAPFTRAALQAEALPPCTPDDLAVADDFAPVLDAADLLVGMQMGEPLCQCEAVAVDLAGGRVMVPRMLKTAGQPPPNDPPRTIAGFIGTGVIQDPTPQPAKPGQPDSSSLAPAPPTPVSNSDKN